ncbi:thioesterase family protein [Roseobacter litoralis]|uniref:Thioesterase-like protein n=1 Tax=Roseobacter litoralis (strain ATCC 49566 / DSM 6996 / JCM 21268 / NBRC 15278 / OCh 149) TaxID=391595 RepID=F7ZCU5_ROSLO|nr:thioesterase family protein [Roseobacter litoralis]AEI94519.1 thioesterase-like protein [Roseobacter litoralis Och 149]
MSLSVPFRSSVARVRPEWIDYNGHMNMAYYAVLFDEAGDEIYPEIGFGPDYQKTGFTTYTAEFHICYLRELHLNDAVTVTLQLIDFDEKRFHFYQEIWHEDGWCAATGEAMGLHVDQSGPKVAAMPPHVLANLKKLHDAHAKLPRPHRVGRRIGIPR